LGERERRKKRGGEGEEREGKREGRQRRKIERRKKWRWKEKREKEKMAGVPHPLGPTSGFFGLARAYPTQVLGEELCLVIEGRLKRLILLVPSVLHWND
jgi:hypothetical protein